MPFTSFSENEVLPDGRRPPVWFALGEDRPMACFAGIWTRWTSVRKVKEGEVTADLFGFLTTEPNAVVGPIHPKAMPVILTTPEECDVWMSAPAAEALALAAAVAGRRPADRRPGREAGSTERGVRGKSIAEVAVSACQAPIRSRRTP